MGGASLLAGRPAIEVPPHPTLTRRPVHPSWPSVSQHPSPRAGQLPASLGHLCAALGLPATIVITTKGPPCTYHLPIIHSNQTAAPVPLTSPSPLPSLYSVSYTQTAGVCAPRLPPFLCYPHREAQLGKCAAFKKELPPY